MDVEYCFKACCTLHNMLLKYKGSLKVNNWEMYDPDDIEEQVFNAHGNEYNEVSEMRNPHNVAFQPQLPPSEPARVVPWYLKQCLIFHFIFSSNHD